MVEQTEVGDATPLEKIAWNVKSGATTYWNVASKDITPPVIERQPPTLTEFSGAVITPRGITPRSEVSEANRKRVAVGAVYDRDLNILPIFAEREAFETAGDNRTVLNNPHKLDESQIKDIELLRGRYVYLGYLRGHFGHFLLESISRMWAVLNSDPDINIIMHGHQDLDRLPSYIKHTFALLELNPERITMIRSTRIVEQLIFPESEFEIRWKGSASYAELFREMHQRNSRLFSAGHTPNRVYLTRRKLKVKNDRARMKVVQNEEVVEKLFASRGFEIVAPETLPFHQQIATMGRARQIAGMKGSALHMSLFSQHPKARVIQLCRRPSINQTIVNGIKNFESHDIACQSHLEEGGAVVDVEVLHAALRAM